MTNGGNDESKKENKPGNYVKSTIEDVRAEINTYIM